MDSSSSGGLRRRQAVDTEANKASSQQNDLNDNFKDGTGDEDNMEEASDKETRLTLMEEVLLLGLKDKEVSWHSRLWCNFCWWIELCSEDGRDVETSMMWRFFSHISVQRQQNQRWHEYDDDFFLLAPIHLSWLLLVCFVDVLMRFLYNLERENRQNRGERIVHDCESRNVNVIKLKGKIWILFDTKLYSFQKVLWTCHEIAEKCSIELDVFQVDKRPKRLFRTCCVI